MTAFVLIIISLSIITENSSTYLNNMLALTILHIKIVSYYYMFNFYGVLSVS